MSAFTPHVASAGVEENVIFTKTIINTQPSFVNNSKFKKFKNQKNNHSKISIKIINWSKEMFETSKINNTDPVIYKIKKLNNEDIKGSPYAE